MISKFTPAEEQMVNNFNNKNNINNDNNNINKIVIETIIEIIIEMKGVDPVHLVVTEFVAWESKDYHYKSPNC